MFKRKNNKEKVLDYVYERQTIEDVQTYIVKKENEMINLIPLQHFYYSILGDKTIDKLIGKGYLSMEEFNQKYNNIPIEQQAIKIKKRH